MMSALDELRFSSNLAPRWSTARGMLLEQLSTVRSLAEGVVLSDDNTPEGERDPLVATSQNIVACALEALDVVGLLYGEDAPCDLRPRDPDSPDTCTSETWFDRFRVVKTVALIRGTLKIRKRALSSITLTTRPNVKLTTLKGALDGVKKAMTAVQNAIVETEQLSVRGDISGSAMERAVATRRVYIGLHRIVVQYGTPSEDSLWTRARLVQTSLIELLTSPAARQMRMADRMLLAVMNTKLCNWITEGHRAAARTASGMLLWEELITTATSFMDLNRHPELVKHDGEIAWEVFHDIKSRGRAWNERASEAARDRLMPLMGRSAALDTLLHRQGMIDHAHLCIVLETLGTTLVASPPPPVDKVPKSTRRTTVRSAGSVRWAV